VLTDKWLPAVPALQVLCLFGVIRSVDVLFPPVLRARNRTRFTLLYNLILLALLPVAFWGGALWKGTVGVAWMWILVYPLATLWMIHVALREISLRWNDLWVQLRPPVVSTLIMVGVLLALRMGMSSWGDEHAGMRMATMILVGAIAYGAVMFNISGPLIDEIKEIIGWVFRGERVLARSQAKLPDRSL
jgi:Na+-driven multidrug efflux pump